VIIGAVIVYLSGWMVHFTILTEPGDGDLWREPTWEQPIMASFWRETQEIHKIMYKANSGLTAEHHDSSLWWTWPLVRTPVFYWQQSDEVTAKSGSIYFQANPILWWGASAAWLVVLLTWLMMGVNWVAAMGRGKWGFKLWWHKAQDDWQGSFLQRAWIPLLGYWAAFIPLMKVTRVLFLYHYLTPLLFSIIGVTLWLDWTGWIKSGSVKKQRKGYWIVLGLVVLFFLYFSPFTYGFLLSEEVRQWLFWFKTWR